MRNFTTRDGGGGFDVSRADVAAWRLEQPGLREFPAALHQRSSGSRDGIAWTLVKPNSFILGQRLFTPNQDWEGRHTAGYAVLNDKMRILGGDVNQGHYHYDVWNSEDGSKWNLVNKNAPVPWGLSAAHHTVVHQGKIWILGGQTVPPQFAWWKEEFYRDIWNTADGIHWDKVGPNEPFLAAAGNDRRERRVPRPHLDSRRRHL